MSMARARKEYEWNEANRIQIRFKMDNIGLQLAEFMENEAMDFGCVTPEYVYRSWGGVVAIEEIANSLKQVKLPM